MGWALLIAAALCFRLAVVQGWHAPAGDGQQYYRLSQELRRDGRYAFAPPPAPLTYARMPGYPLFLARVAVRQAPLPLEDHLLRAARWNAALDVGTGLLVAALAGLLGLGAAAALLGFAAVIVCPLLLYLSGYGLSESLATFLATLAAYLALRALRTPRAAGRLAALCGAVCGLLVLVRADGAALVPALLLALLLAPLPWHRRALCIGAFTLCAVLVFAPWPLRNLARFHAPHPEAATWVDQEGRVLPPGMMRWMRSWATGRPGESSLIYLVANHMPIFAPAVVGALPWICDGPAERKEVLMALSRYDLARGQLTPEVDAAFQRLANARARRAPLRTYALLPLRRLLALWRPMPPEDLPFRLSWLGLPRLRGAYAVFEQLLLLLSIYGAAWLWRRERAVVLVLAAAVATRCAVVVAFHPMPVQRYLAECFPLLLLCTACALAAAPRWLRGEPAS